MHDCASILDSIAKKTSPTIFRMVHPYIAIHSPRRHMQESYSTCILCVCLLPLQWHLSFVH